MWGEKPDEPQPRCEIKLCPRPAGHSFGVCDVHWREFLRWLDHKHGQQTVDL